MNRIQRIIKDPFFSFKRKLVNAFPDSSPDKWFLQVKFYKCMGYKLDLKHPKTFNEKLQWLKLYDRDPLYTTLVDKYRVKEYVADKIGAKYVIPTLAVYHSADEIDLAKLPNQFVLKCNHDSGSVIVCRDKQTFNLNEAREKLRIAMQNSYYNNSREWPYKKVERCIIAEEYITDNRKSAIRDYKFFCFGGKPLYCQVIDGRDSLMTINFYDMNWQLQPFVEPIGYANSKEEITKPIHFEEMVEKAEALAEGKRFVRIDFYESNSFVKFGEMTFFPTGGYGIFDPPIWANIFGEKVLL